MKVKSKNMLYSMCKGNIYHGIFGRPFWMMRRDE
uniref:Uncharacterized protein n=1 Tax=Tetranychus urticae TaxID=32264 RepID=T1KH72_TETUR